MSEMRRKAQKGLFFVAEPDRSYRMAEYYVWLHYRVLCGQWSAVWAMCLDCCFTTEQTFDV